MTGVSLGLRTGSNGSLQQSLQNSVAQPIQLPPFFARKQSKMLQYGAKEKEKILPWVCRMAGHRRAGMLLLVAISLLAFFSLMPILNKEEDAQGIAVARRLSSEPISKFGHDEFTMISYRNTLRYKEKTIEDGNLASSSILFTHPCDHFVIPPPPPPTDGRRIGPRPCPVCYIPVEQAIDLMPVSPSFSPVLKKLMYIVEEDKLFKNDTFGGSDFGGYPTLAQRDDSYDIKESMTVHCGFVRGKRPGHETGFDIDATDLLEMEQCREVVVASAIFGNYDEIQQPKNISDAARRALCFFMFVDEKTISSVRKSNALDSTMNVGLWRVVVVKNLPYRDPRRNGKVPKLLLHRLFPNVRFSIWIDGKLELVVDPFQILERFLWRTKDTFAISRHYRRFDVFEEAEANKAAGKYSNASIDAQIEFYKNEGLTPYSSSKLPITSDVPEGCVIIREHIPITNLFTCLWFNEVDRFTSRDQLSFSTVRDKIISKVNWGVNMFFDCERRNFVVQAYHRDVLVWKNAMMRAAAARSLPVSTGMRQKPSIITGITNRVSTRIPARKFPPKRPRERRSSSRRRRPRTGSIKEVTFS